MLVLNCDAFIWCSICIFRSPKTMLNPPVNGKNQELFKAFEWFSSSFQGKYNFQGLFRTVLYIQVLFKPVRTLQINYRIMWHFISVSTVCWDKPATSKIFNCLTSPCSCAGLFESDFVRNPEDRFCHVAPIYNWPSQVYCIKPEGRIL